MASAKDLKKKIHSISNTGKITRTMEMVSAAKSKQTTSRVEANTAYSETMAEILARLCEGGAVHHPLLERPEGVDRNALLVLSANRGLCGGYNSNLLSRAERWIREQREEGRETDAYVVGKKGMSRFRFRGLPIHSSFTHIEDRPRFEEAEAFARTFIERFRAAEVAEVWVASTRYFSPASQRPVMTRLLPITPPEREEKAAGAEQDFVFEPDAGSILEALLPFSVSQLVYRLLIEAAASEQIARRMAMKLATDNAEELKRGYTLEYNRQRQAGITQQIMEIVGGAQALG